MKFKKPVFWDKKKPSFLSYLLFPLSLITMLINKKKKKIINKNPNISNFREIYKLLQKINLSTKIKNTVQLIKKVDLSLVKKNNSSKKINKLKRIGITILSKNFNEIKNYI